MMLLAVLVGKLIKWEPMISGSGIPQVEGEILGKLNQNWLKFCPLSLREDFFVCSADCLLAGKVRLYSLSDERTGNITDFKQREKQKNGI